jgi:hypothetical protein
MYEGKFYTFFVFLFVQEISNQRFKLVYYITY